MIISSIFIQNFRKLLQCRIDFSKNKTIFVGANNSGKTSAMDALGKFLASRDFTFNDFTILNRTKINEIGLRWTSGKQGMPEDLGDWDTILPKMDVWIDVNPNEIHYVSSIIPTLKWRGGKLGVRLIFQPKDITKLFQDYQDSFNLARKVESSGSKVKESQVNLFPRDLCDFIESKLSVYFCIKSYILDPAKLVILQPQPTPYESECFTDNPLKGIIKIDFIDAQRGFSDPDHQDQSEKTRRHLSAQIRSYYDKHLDPEKNPSSEDLETLEATNTARVAFESNLQDKFKPAIKELEDLGYPGVADPKMTITTKANTSEMLNHESAIQYELSKSDSNLKLPEKYNGLGYQNLISIIFDLMCFRDAWMRKGKASQNQELTNAIEPLHLVLVEEPEAHLHMQVQQVFIRKAYSVLRNHASLNEETEFSTQLVISTHSSHIARESDFADLRYFKRLPESSKCGIGTAEVINLSDIFGKEDETDKFVTRYLQTTHCDLFFADAAILVEGSAESMLLPHFIRDKFPKLHQSYITILPINGRHTHRLDPLIKTLCLPTLIITDLDSCESGGHHAGVRPERKKKLLSGNYTIAKWLIKKENLDELLDLDPTKKILAFNTTYEYSICVAYQTPANVVINGKSVEALACTFEDCLVYTNFELFRAISTTNVGNLIKKAHEAINSGKDFDEIHKDIYEVLKNGKSDQKAEFALDLIFCIDPKELTIPNYIDEGLTWLQNTLYPIVSPTKK